MPLTPEDKTKISEAFGLLEKWTVDAAAATALGNRAKQAVRDLDVTLRTEFPLNQAVRIPGTRFKVVNQGDKVQVKQDTPELSLEDLG